MTEADLERAIERMRDNHIKASDGMIKGIRNSIIGIMILVFLSGLLGMFA